jgi:hypothetical protein
VFGDRFARSWQIVKASAEVLRTEKTLLVFPVLSGMAALLLGAFMVWDAFGSGFFQQMKSGTPDTGAEINAYVWMFAFYVVQYFVIIFFNTALVGAAIARLSGGDPTVADGLALAFSRVGSIFGYAIVAATVGVLLRTIAERGGIIGRIVGAALGLAWTVVTFLVVPVMAAEGVGPVEAVKRSAELLRGTWGENLIGNGAISVIFSGIIALIVGVAYLGSWMLSHAGHSHAGTGIFLVALVLVLPIAAIGAALSGIYSAALYIYAVSGAAPDGFGGLMKNAFRAKG